LPVYVRPGAILPVAPVTQNTGEQPKGPLTLRVYAGADCHGALYADDGHTFAYRQGDYLRMQFTCEVGPRDLSLHIGEHEGSYHAWWSQVRVEVYGVASKAMTVKTKEGSVPAKRQGEAVEFTVADDGHGMEINVN
jgi:alpha-glucosidase